MYVVCATYVHVPPLILPSSISHPHFSPRFPLTSYFLNFSLPPIYPPPFLSHPSFLHSPTPYFPTSHFPTLLFPTPLLPQGVDATQGGIQLVSRIIYKSLGMDVSVLMGANIATEVAQEQFCESTLG